LLTVTGDCRLHDARPSRRRHRRRSAHLQRAALSISWSVASTGADAVDNIQPGTIGLLLVCSSTVMAGFVDPYDTI